MDEGGEKCRRRTAIGDWTMWVWWGLDGRHPHLRGTISRQSKGIEKEQHTYDYEDPSSPCYRPAYPRIAKDKQMAINP